MAFESTSVDGSITPDRFLRTLLAEPGGNTNAIGNYTAAPVVFSHTVTMPSVLCNFELAMTFVGKTDVLYYGPIVGTPPGNPGLTIGLRIQIMLANGTKIDLDNELPLKTNKDIGVWGTRGAALQVDPEPGRNDQAFIAINLDFDVLARDILLYTGDSVQVTLHDDFTGLLNQTFEIAGYSVAAVV